MRNSFKNYEFGHVEELIKKTSFWVKNSVYSSSSAALISGIVGGIYGRISSYFNPNGDFIGI